MVDLKQPFTIYQILVVFTIILKVFCQLQTNLGCFSFRRFEVSEYTLPQRTKPAETHFSYK